MEVSVDEVKECLSNLDTSKACGPDGIPARQLKNAVNKKLPASARFSNLSLSRGKIAYEWKTADITPIHKKYSKEPAENYQPILLLNTVSKVLERCVGSRFYDHVKHSFTLLRHGFLRNRSCITQLLSVLHAIRQALDKNIQTDGIYLDLRKHSTQSIISFSWLS